jgi:hypothetical protein
VTTAELTKQSESWDSPWDKPACERLVHDSSPFVFTASAEKVVSQDGELILDGKCVKTLVQAVTLRRLEAFRGDIASTVTVRAGDLNGFFFKTGQRYLVFADKASNGDLIVSGRSQSRPMKEAAADLAYLRSYPTLSMTGEVFGGAFRGAPGVDQTKLMVPKMVPMTGTRITLDGAAKREGIIDSRGRYNFAGLPPGHYKIEVHTRPNVTGGASRDVEVMAKGCAQVNFAEYPQNPELTNHR